MNQSRQSIDPWVFREWGLASLGDARLTARALRLASDLAAHPDLSLASLYEGDWASLKAGYRFFDNPKVTPAKLLEPHQSVHVGTVRIGTHRPDSPGYDLF